jgi:hypothetical protein
MARIELAWYREHDQAGRAAGHVFDCPVFVLWEQGRFEGKGNPAHDVAGLGKASRVTRRVRTSSQLG